ncbi:MFS general substrate transporter [Lentinus tigrinus ALCF2SS1-7]|uniref:Autophagy-related protein n=1 Tax=Lentinus tigrinus ALCF2SS1-6 TaxID=1328759 RepID=A0A5C2SUI5_9APHY|nr:MFS general substrate transporter [Lentinus tigrinus ALCF2SS1-6]RPD80720.1 MFS general substrate transporter [Lentinus tigrinus ALCF2SS1-7]
MSRQPVPEVALEAARPPLVSTETRNGLRKDSAELEAVPIEPVSKDEPIVTRRELWSYYLYYNGDNGVGPNGYSMTLFQSLATAAGYDPVRGPGSSCSGDGSSGQCVLPWGGGHKAVSSIVLVANGVSFAIMTLIFTTIGSAADYGSFGRWLLFTITVICWGAQFASVSLTSPDRWGVAMALYMIGFISYGATLVFYAAIFPRLARNTKHARDLREKYERGEVPAEEYEVEESMEKNRISNISTMHSNIGYIFTLALNLSLLLPLKTHPKVNNYVIVFTNGYWVLTGIWWFIFQQPRPGPSLPKGEHYLTVGWKQIWIAFKQYKKLPYTFVYLVAFFLLADGLNTTGTLVSICQNDKFSFSFLQNTYLGLAQAVTSTASTLGFWYIQRYWKISTKKMASFVVTNVVTIMIPLWGMIGIWTTKLGFHNVWEFWAYNVVFGLFQAPYYAFSQTMMAELTPPGFDNMFFGLFGLSNRASSMIGPNVIQAIIDNTGDNWKGFPFLFALCTAASLVIWFGVDVTSGRRDAVLWAEKNRAYAETGMLVSEEDSAHSMKKD